MSTTTIDQQQTLSLGLQAIGQIGDDMGPVSFLAPRPAHGFGSCGRHFGY